MMIHLAGDVYTKRGHKISVGMQQSVVNMTHWITHICGSITMETNYEMKVYTVMVHNSHQYHQNEQPPLTSNNWTQKDHDVWSMTYDVWR